MADQDAADARLWSSDAEVQRLLSVRASARRFKREADNLHKGGLAQMASGDFNSEAINPTTLAANRASAAAAQAEADRATTELRKRGFQG